MDNFDNDDGCEVESRSQISSAQSTKSSKTKSRRFNKVWNDFDYVEAQSPTKKAKAICKHCGKEYGASFVSGTSNFKRHIDNCPKRCKELNTGQLDQQGYQEVVAKAIIKHGYPFTWSEHSSNRDVHVFLNKSIQPVSRNTIKADCLKLHQSLKQELKSVLKATSGRICLTSDMWTLCTSRGFSLPYCTLC
ncbi:hypothetical protein PTKIN_Ptkin11bG0067100 [Pterospermum kingtungense]